MTDKPLAGIRVIEVAGFAFVPAAGAILADLGAEVIKIEPPTGDPMRSLENDLNRLLKRELDHGPSLFTEFCNRGKRSVSADLTSDAGHEILLRLVKDADVYLTSNLSEVCARLHTDVDSLRAVNPRLVYARGSGWGPKGPLSNRPGFDLAAGWASSGAANRICGADGEPVPMPFAFFDLQASEALVGAVATALFRRERSGEPSVIDVSLLNVAWWAMQPDIIAAPFTSQLGRMNRLAPGNPLVNWYETVDGRWIYLVAMQSDRYWVELCELIGRPELIEDSRYADAQARFENREECAVELSSTFRERPFDEWCEVLSKFSGVWSPALTPQEVASFEQGHANGYFPTVVTNSGLKLQLVAPPFQFDETPVSPTGPAPELGQDTELVLIEAGFTWDEISELRDRGAMG